MTNIETPGRPYQATHPWISFEPIDLRKISYELWLLIGECRSKCEHLAGVPLPPETAQEFYKIYLAKGVQATTAIEGNTLSEQEVRDRIDHKLELPPSKEYLGQEVDNILDACNTIAQDIYGHGQTHLAWEKVQDFNRLVLRGLELDNWIVPGEIPVKPMGVGNYKGAPREDCVYLVQRLCDWINGPNFAPVEPLGIGMAFIKAIVAHVYFEWIHPFGDGNGRTGRLIEFQILNASGVPAPASHLLSNHYNQTRQEYYRQLDRASKSGGDLGPFLLYALRGFRDGLAEQILKIRQQQIEVSWENYIHKRFAGKTSKPPRRQRELALALSRAPEPVSTHLLRSLSPQVADAYAGKTLRTLIRDLNVLQAMNLIIPIDDKWVANKNIVLAWLPHKVDIETVAR